MEQPVAHSDEAEKSGLSVGSALSTVFKLLIVLGLAYITVLGLKWLSSKKVPLPQNTRDLKLMETLRLSPSNTLHVVNTRGKSFLVGCTSGQLSILTELDPAEDTVPAENSGSGFAEYLAKYSDGHANKGGASRMAGLLRDCTEYLQTRTIKSRAQTGGGDEA
jgi:flagellar biogenesis protein FliO